MLSSCGGGSAAVGGRGATSVSNNTSTVAVQNQENSPLHCRPSLSIYNSDPSKPIITLMGAKVEVLSIGDTYIDSGATAEDEQDGDLSTVIEVYGIENIDTSTVGDYMLRYEVSDADENSALPVYRFVRVSGEEVVRTSKRFFSEVNAVWEYVEHLPAWFGLDSEERYPLIIANHGWNHSKRFDRSGSMAGMFSASMVQFVANWARAEDLPYITLTPQRCWGYAGCAVTRVC